MQLNFDEMVELLRTSGTFRKLTAETIIRLMTDAPALLETPDCSGCDDRDIRAIVDNWE
jgi:hypothetical protein